MSRRDGVVRDPAERLYWLHSPVCLERREETGEERRGEAPQFRRLAELARRASRALSRMLGLGPC